MNSIMGFSNLLKEHSYDPSQINEYLEYITDGAQNLLNIVTNIVEISKISANDVTVSIKKFNFTRLINDIYSRFYSKAKMNGLDYTLEYNSSYNDLWIVADDGKLSSAISHLLDNALKFTNEGSIKLSFTIKADQLEVCVQDTGIGIAPEMKDDIFESFKQADVTLSRAYGGTGLGLSITKAYIEKMGGQIRFDSVQGKGSTFCISFPFTISSEKASEDFNIASISEELNILVVEDEEMNYFYLREILKNRCKNIYHARDGYSAIEYCKNNPTINMVLMDIKLPGINGLEATIEIKKIRPDLPVIAQTAYTLVGDREKALSAGCNDYISKPINREKLYSIMNSFVKEQNL